MSKDALDVTQADTWRRICRVCQGKKYKLMSLFESFKDLTFSHYISALADVKISEDDQLPSSICKPCVRELENVLQFKEKCVKSDKYFHDVLLGIEVKVDSVTDVKAEDEIKKTDSNEESKEVEIVATPSEIKIEFVNSSLIKEENIKQEDFEGKIHGFEDDNNGFDIDDDDDDDDEDKPLSKVSVKRKKSSVKKAVKKAAKKAKKNKSENKPIYINTGLDCFECNKSFENAFKRKAHWYAVHRNKRYNCEICQRNFKSMVVYERHLSKGVGCRGRYEHVRVEGEGPNKMYHCTACDYKKRTRADVWRHSLKHTGEHPYTCNMCTKAYTSHKSLSYHKETVHKVYKAEITCHLCGKVVKGTHRFNRHFRSTHPNTRYQCDICKTFVKTKWGLVYHIKTHENLKEYICESCGKTFNTPINLRNHIRVNHEKDLHDEDDKEYVCEPCGKVFHALSVYQRHRWVAHEKPAYDCQICKYQTRDRKCLKRHLKQHALNKFQCAVCFRFMDSPLKLIKHMDIHGEKKHFCLYCNKGFVRKKDCSKHERLRHINKPLKYKQEQSPISVDM